MATLNYTRANTVPMNPDMVETVETEATGKVVEYIVWSVDCWGNSEEGYEMNDRARVGKVELPEDGNDEQWMTILEDAGFLKDGSAKVGKIDGDDGLYYVDDKRDGRMWLQLESTLS